MIKESSWITSGIADTGGAAEFIKKFTLKSRAVKAQLSVTAIGVYEAYLNGQRVGDFIFAPGCTAYNKRLQYQTYDVTDMLSEQNKLSVTVGKGWHRSRMSENRPEINKKPCALIAELEIVYDSGTREFIRTDGTWLSRKTNVVFNDFYDGEACDASFEAPAAEKTETVELDKEILIPQEGEIVCEQEVLRPKELIITPKGEKVIDFGQNITGYVELSVTANKGDRIAISHAEVLDRDGNFYNANYRSAKAKIEYICRDGHQTYKPRFAFYGFRYIRLDEYPREIDKKNFCAIAVYSDMKRTGRIQSGSEKLNKLYSNALWSQRDNFLDIPTDCPQRDERMGWTGDAQVFAKTACYNYNAKRFFEKWLGDLRAEQRADGSIPETVPNLWNTPLSSTAWGDVITILPWQLYRMYGDTKILADNFDAMKGWVDYITGDTLEQYLWICSEYDKKSDKHNGDWLAIDAPCGSRIGSTDIDFIASAFYAYSTELLVKAGKSLGKDMTEYDELHSNIVITFKKTFTSYATQTECVLALYFNLTDDKTKCAEQLNDMIILNGNKLKTGFVGTPYLLYALSDNGYAETAYNLLLQEEYPSWLYEVNHGATTIWEHWDGIRDDGSFWSADMNSYNHYAYGSVIDWVYSVAGGIRPDGAGFKSAVIAPVPDKRLGWLDVSYETEYGKITSKWAYEGESVRYEITTPVPAAVIIGGKEYKVDKGSYVFYE